MLNLFSQHLYFLSSIFLLSALSSFFVLLLIDKSTPNFFSFLYIKAKKSHTHASLLGGLSLSISALFAISCLLFYGKGHLTIEEMFVLKCSLFPILTTTLYGYLDDKYEIRARHKLFLQILAVTSFVTPLASILYQGHWGAIAISVVFGLAYINGSNLIDGLDTLFVKIGSITAIGFFFLAWQMDSLPAATLSILTCGSLGAFYFFNKEPAKIYAGEIGGSILGVLLFIQGNFLFAKLGSTSQQNALDLFFKILIISIYPLSELGITFSRRIFFKKSPFRGDHLHIHHIIKSKFILSPSKTSNVIASILIITIFAGSIIMSALPPVWAFACSVICLSWIYSSTCYKHWKKSYSENNKKEIFLSLSEKMIYVIDGKEIDSLYSKYHPSTYRNDYTDEETAA